MPRVVDRSISTRIEPHIERCTRGFVVCGSYPLAFPVLALLMLSYHNSWYMGLDALISNGISQKIFYLLRDRHLTPVGEPLRRVRKSRIILFLSVELIGFGATFAITQTIGSSSLGTERSSHPTEH